MATLVGCQFWEASWSDYAFSASDTFIPKEGISQSTGFTEKACRCSIGDTKRRGLSPAMKLGTVRKGAILVSVHTFRGCY